MIKIIEHKNWNTKKVYGKSGQFLMITYFRCPKHLLFKNKMVNDDNQHLCGGWGYFKDNNAEIWKRVKKGLKPMGTLHFWAEDEAKALAMFKEIKKEGKKFHSLYKKRKDRITILVSVRGKMKDLFDLDSLIKDYANIDIDIEEDVQAVANMEINKFFEDWDNNDWLTGLILGYPIENTMAWMRQCLR